MRVVGLIGLYISLHKKNVTVPSPSCEHNASRHVGVEPVSEVLQDASLKPQFGTIQPGPLIDLV